LDTIIELTRQRDELLEQLKEYVNEYGSIQAHGTQCLCYECQMNNAKGNAP